MAIFLSKALHVPYEDCMALGYSVTAKAHAITISIAIVSFSGSLAVLPPAVALVIQIPIMLLFLSFSSKIQGYLKASAQHLSLRGPLSKLEGNVANKNGEWFS